MKERLGKFYFPIVTIVDNIEELYESFSLLKFVPIKAEFLYDRRLIECMGFSPLFEEIEEGTSATEYIIISIKTDDKITEVRAEKLENIKDFKI